MGKLAVVVVAAGKGTRMGTAVSKQFLLLQDKPILMHTLETFEHAREVDEIVIVTGKDDVSMVGELVKKGHFVKVKGIVEGGSERQHSVAHGLRALAHDAEWVMVHDAVRPFVRQEHITALYAQAIQCDAAVLAVPVKETIKLVDEHGVIVNTPDRDRLWSIQTPQCFRTSLLMEAHERAEADRFLGTDDAMLVERMGAPVKIVRGGYDNIKITTPEDLQWAEVLIKERDY